MEIKNTMLIIATTSFAKKLCEEPKTWTILSDTALQFGAQGVEIRDIGNTASGTNTEENINVVDIAASIFD